MILDSIRQNLLRYADDGRARGDAAGPLAKSSADPDFLSVARRSDGLTGDGRIILQAKYNQFQVLSPSLTFETGFDFLGLPTNEGSTIEGIYSWAPTWAPKRKDIVAFADLKKGDQWSSGVVRVPFDARNAEAQVLRDLPVNDVSRTFHRLGFQLIGSYQEDAYVLLMETGFALWKSDRNGKFEELPRFRESFPPKDVPVLPAFIRQEDFAQVMSEVEKAAMPIGVHSWREGLFVVWRRPQETGGTEWLLSRVRKTDGKILGTVTINKSRANHLFAIPGDDAWSFIEKGPALGTVDQEVRGVLTVSGEGFATAMAAAESSGKPGSGTPLCP